VGRLPRFPSDMRDLAVRRGSQRGAGAEVARSSLRRVHAGDYVRLLDGDLGEPLIVPTAANIGGLGPHHSILVVGEACAEPRSLRGVAAQALPPSPCRVMARATTHGPQGHATRRQDGRGAEGKSSR
jgi:hypothetical protein